MNIAVWEQPQDDEEPQACALSPEDREFVIAKLAEMLVGDYQQHEENQAVIATTVKESPALNRGGGAFVQTPDPYAGRQLVQSMGQFIST